VNLSSGADTHKSESLIPQRSRGHQSPAQSLSLRAVEAVAPSLGVTATAVDVVDGSGIDRFCGLHPLNWQGGQASCRRKRIWGPRFRREPLVVVSPWLATEIARSLSNPEFCRIRQNAHVIRRGYPARRSASF